MFVSYLLNKEVEIVVEGYFRILRPEPISGSVIHFTLKRHPL